MTKPPVNRPHDDLVTRAGVPSRYSTDGRLVLIPGDEPGLARALAALVEAGLPLRLVGIDPDDGPAVSLASFSRVTGVRATDAVAIVEPGTPWSTFEAALAETAFECPVFPAADPAALVLAVAAGRVPVRAFNPFGPRAEWVRDLRLVTPQGTVVRSPYSPRRATGPELRLPALALGAAWGVSTSLTVRVVPRSPREERVLALPDAGAAFDLLERLGASGDEASFLAEAHVTPKGSRVRIVWRHLALREPPDDLWRAEDTATWEPPSVEPFVAVRVPWGDATRAWLAGLSKPRRKPSALSGLRLWGPDRQGITAELAGFADLGAAAAAGVLPGDLAERVARLAPLRARLTMGGPA